MMVTFVSQCEKKALNRTRRVLDAFANRIGDNTWQTVITQEGLQAVKKLLRKTASKNTAVSCFWIRSRSRSELVWIVGNRDKFNAEGVVPVNITLRNIMNTQDENDWQYLPLIKALSAIAALFHDWGKASEFFQYKLRQKKVIGDPYRHEWVSLLFISALCQGKSDEEWLDQLSKGNLDFSSLKLTAEGVKRPFKDLPETALVLSWLVVTHHRLPVSLDTNTHKTQMWPKLLKRIQADWGYQNKFENFDEELKRCFDYPNGLPSNAKPWLKEVKKWAQKLQGALPLLRQATQDGSWRPILQYSRLCLMLGDHYYSSLEPASPYRVKHRELKLYANTDKHKKPKQTLDEHLIGVTKQALRNAHFLPVFEGVLMHGESVLQHAYDIASLKKKSNDKNFRWQDTAVQKIQAWRAEQAEKQSKTHFGFFAVNMASTGKGKTFANAKIMQALSPNGDSLRYVLALGLRTLTLQTGDEYRDRIGLKDDELAVLIGSKAVLDLHNQLQNEQSTNGVEFSGSESSESLLDNELNFEVNPHIEEMLKPVLQRSKDRQFLYAPVLVCTIDHIISATETKRGGRYILPTLRLMYSDLVIDEIDDFDGDDLIAIGRLIHLAGMLGRKVMISSATIPPDLAEGYFNSYQSGWALFAQTRGESPVVGCAWIDEFKTQIHNIAATQQKVPTAYSEYHQAFIKIRLEKLATQTVKRKAEITPLTLLQKGDDTALKSHFFNTIQQAILSQHNRHAHIDEKTGKKISFGVVRIANISPCIQLTHHLLAADWGDKVNIRAMAYHSQQVLIMRNAQEKHLDTVLKRKQGKQAALEHPVIRQHIDSIEAEGVIFILIATPVEEVGRDHDFDWAVIEPSSYRSFVQLAGRVLRHQELVDDIPEANIAILQHNLKGLKGDKIAFARPGYESTKLALQSHDLECLIDTKTITTRLDASLRVQRSTPLQPHENLADLEHESIHRLLTAYDQQGASSLQDWLTGSWWLTGLPQQLVRFRQGAQQQNLYLVPTEGGMKFCGKSAGGGYEPVEKEYGIHHEGALSEQQYERLWLQRDYLSLLEGAGKASLEDAALVYGEINILLYPNEANPEFIYSSQFGLTKQIQ